MIDKLKELYFLFSLLVDRILFSAENYMDWIINNIFIWLFNGILDILINAVGWILSVAK